MILSVPVLVPVRELVATAPEVLVWELPVLVVPVAEGDRSAPRKARPARRERKQGQPPGERERLNQEPLWCGLVCKARKASYA